MSAASRAARRSDPLDATVALPGSKSITNRALICAASSPGMTVLRGALAADDTHAMVECLARLGTPVAWRGDELHIGVSRPVDQAVTLDARMSGTTARFITPFAATHSKPRRIDGDPQLRARPMAPTFDALAALGVEVLPESSPGHLPVTIRGPVRGAEVRVRGDESSQFLSGLLLSGPGMPRGLSLVVEHELVSRPYVDMTVAVMERFGAEVDTSEPRRFVVAPRSYDGQDYTVEPDASAASYFWAAAVISGGAVTVPGLSRDALQGDVAFVQVLERMGAEVTDHGDAITVRSTGRLRGIDVDMEAISDTVPTLAVVAAFAEGTTTIRNVGFIRKKESNRIRGPVDELRKLGVDAAETDDGLVVRPGRLQPAEIDTYRDHRMAMAFALVGLVQDGVVIRNPGCVDKTFPAFWSVLDAAIDGSGPPARSG